MTSACSHRACPSGGDAYRNARSLARALGGGGYLFLLFKGAQREEGHLLDVSRLCGDGGCDLEGETPVEKEFLWVLRARWISLGRDIRVVPSAVCAKMR